MRDGLAFKPDIVLLDVHMPHLSGLEVLAKVRAQQAPNTYLPIILLTADPSRELKRQALEGGADDFLARPYDPDEVLLRLRNLLHARALHQRLHTQNATLATQVAARTRHLKQKEAEARRHAERAQQLAALSAHLETLNVPRDVVRAGLEAFIALWEFDVGMLFRFDGPRLLPTLTVGTLPPQLATRLNNLDLEPSGELQRQVMNQDHPVVVPDYSAWALGDPGMRAAGLRTTIGVPLRVDGQLHRIMYLGKFGEPAALDESAHTVLRGI